MYLFLLCLYFAWLAAQNFVLPWIYQQQMASAATVGVLMASKEAVLALALVLLAHRALDHGWRLRAVDLLALAYAGLLILYVPLGPALLGSQATLALRLISLRSLIALVLFYFWGRLSFLAVRGLRQLIWFVLGLQATVAVFGLCEWFFLPASFWSDTIGVGRFMLDVKGLLDGQNVINGLPGNLYQFGVRRVISTYGDPLAMGIASVFPLLLGLAVGLRDRPLAGGHGFRWRLWIPVALVAAALLLTLGRESIAAAGLGVLVLLWWSGQFRRALVPALLAFVSVLCLPQLWTYAAQTISFRESSAALHLRFLRSGWKQIPNLLLGKGLGEAGGWAFSLAGVQTAVGESSYFDLMAQTGVLSVVLLSGFLIALAQTARKRSCAFPDPLISAALLAAAAHVLARSVVAIFSPSLFDVVPLASFFFLCGAAFTALDRGVARPALAARRVLILRSAETPHHGDRSSQP
jgi:hypothetical protein